MKAIGWIIMLGEQRITGICLTKREAIDWAKADTGCSWKRMKAQGYEIFRVCILSEQELKCLK